MNLERLRQLEQAATKAPWEAREAVDGWQTWTVKGANGTRSDAELIAAARNALPALLDIAYTASLYRKRNEHPMFDAIYDEALARLEITN